MPSTASSDSAWVLVDLPHDYSAVDLPEREADESTPVLAVRNGKWRFAEGQGNSTWAAPTFDDSHWTVATVPGDWRDLGYEQTDAYGWFRRTFEVTPLQLNAARRGLLRLALGAVARADVTYINGVQVGNTGAMGKEQSCGAELTYRSYAGTGLNQSLHIGTNVIAVQVWSPGGRKGSERGEPGGLWDAELADARYGMFDAGASPGQRQTGYSVGGVGWYRKHFPTPSAAANGAAKVSVFVEGCYMNCQLYLNGVKIGPEHPYGYTSFGTVLPATLLTAAGDVNNVLSMRVANLGSNSRWYAGSGLFRPVSLHVHPNIHVAPFWEGGIHVVTFDVDLLDGSSGRFTSGANANVTITLVNDGSSDPVEQGPVEVSVTITEVSTGRMIATRRLNAPTVGARSNATFSTGSIPLGSVATWSPEQPALYTASVSVAGGDPENSTFGVRTFSFNATHGLVLNGVPTKLRGGCVHHDNGPLGSRAIARAEYRRVELLKANGYNAIRTSHNPVSRAFVAACEELGVILMEEAFDTWELGKNNEDYHIYFDAWWRRDIASMVLRDRNSPAILLWSIGNEIPMRHSAAGAKLSAALAQLVRELDPAPHWSRRAVTTAYPMPSADAAADAFFAPLDVAGYNYAHGSFGRDHARVPERVMVATETFPALSVENYRAAHDPAVPYVIGSFIWTAIDYIGESAIGANGHYPPSQLACGEYCAQPFPYHISYCGDLDLVGELKPQSLLRRVLWKAAVLELSVHQPGEEVIGAWGYRDERQTWTWPGMPTGTALTVRAYASSGCVVFALNGKPINSRGEEVAPTSAMEEVCVNVTDFVAAVNVTYVPGELTATLHASSNTGIVDEAIASKTFNTAGPPASIRLSTDRSQITASRDDLSYIRAELVDAHGSRVECGSYRGAFNLSGRPAFSPPAWCAPTRVSFALDNMADAEIAAVGSGDPLDVDSFLGSSRRTYRGLATAIIRPGKTGREAPPTAGTLTLTAAAAGSGASAVKGGTIKVEVLA